jgi:hypothetical protein
LQILHVHPTILLIAREHVKSGIGIDDLLRGRLGIIRPSPLGRGSVGIDHHLDSGLLWAVSVATRALC